MRKLAFLLIAFSLGIFPLYAQYTTASLRGTVVDPANDVIPGAKVTVRNTETGLIRTMVTGSEGTYIFSVLPVGHYALTVKKSGFATYTQRGIILTVNETATGDVKLKVGEVSQHISVSANAVMVNTQSATARQLVSRKDITDLPLNGREAQALLFLSPGAVNETGNYCLVACQGGVFPGEQDAVVSGGGNRSVNYLMDGGDYNDPYLNTNLPFPDPDAVQEFSVQYDGESAEYGMGSAVVNVITKSGTNKIHGDAFEFVRNGDFNARNFFAPVQDTLKRNQFGGTAGGPILKNKVFWFGSAQWTRTRQTGFENIGFVPTAAERNGNFSAISTQLVNPATGAPFAGNYISPTLFSPIAEKLLQHIPLPNGPGDQLTYAGPNIAQNQYQWLGKANWDTNRNQLTGSLFWTNFDEPADTTIANTNILATDSNGNNVTVHSLSLNDTYTVSPNLLFNTWFGWEEQTGGSLSGAPFGWPSLGVNIANVSPPAYYLDVAGFFGANSAQLGTFNRGSKTIHEDVAWVHGRQQFHFGVEIIRVNNHLINDYRMNGQYFFTNELSGSNLSDFMLGDASQFIQGGGEFKHMVGTLWNPYVQDNWQVNRRLTVNMGIRWDPFIPYTSIPGRIVCYIPGAKSTRYPNAPVGVLYGGSNHDAGCPSGGAYDNWQNWAPRLGFAYRVKGTTVVRAGAGYYYTPLSMHWTNGFVDTAPFSPQVDYTGNINFQNPYASIGIPSPFPADYGPSVPGPTATFPLPMTIYGMIPLHYQLPRVLSWNFNIQHQFGSNWLAGVSYLGNVSMHDTSSENGYYEQNPAVYIPGTGPNGQPLSTESNLQQRRINPNFGSVGLLYDHYYGNYNALQLSLKKRLSHGLSFNANYTFSKALDNVGSFIYGVPTTNPNNLNFDYGPANYDYPNIFNFSTVWEVPKFPVSHLAGRFVNNWELTGIVSRHSGFPLTFFSGFDNSLTGIGADHAQLIGTNIHQIKLNSGRPDGQLISEYFNTSVFAPNPIGTFGNTGKGVLFGPGYFDTDLSLLKNIPVTERMRLQFRADFFNLFNNVNFGAPDTTVADGPLFGTITSTAPVPTSGGGGAPRILQFALKLMF